MNRNPTEPEPSGDVFHSGATWLGSADVGETVRYLARVASDQQANEFRAAASHNPDIRDMLVETSSLLKQIQAMPLAEVVRLRKEDSLLGEVARAWLEIGSRSLASMAKIRVEGAKIALANLVQAMQAEVSNTPFIRMVLQARPFQPLSPALLRGEEESTNLQIRAELDDKGELTVNVSASPEQAAEWEGRAIEVCLRVIDPVRVGSGALHNGEVEFRVPQVGALLGRTAGPIDPLEFFVMTQKDLEGGVYVLPLEESDSLFENPQLLESISLEKGTLHLNLVIPEPMRTAYDGKRLELFAGLAEAQFQKLLEIPLAKETATYHLTVTWPDAEELTGKLGVGLRYRILL